MLAAIAITAIYLGGAGADDCDDIAFDRAGYAWLACHSNSEGFTGAEKKDMDAFVIKFDPHASTIIHKTRIGGSGWDAAFRVVIDANGEVWVSGTTQSPDFPHNNKCYSGCAAINAFVAHLNTSGALESITVIGDATAEGLVATNGKVYLSGTRSPNAESHSAYVAEIANGIVRLLTLGPGTANGIAADNRIQLFATGFTGKGAFIARIDLQQWNQVAIQHIGSADSDRARAVALDRSGNPYILGTATSSAVASQPIKGKSDVFLASFDPQLKRLRRVTLFGGHNDDFAGFNGASLSIDSRGNAYFTGMTRSTDLPAQGHHSGGDNGFIASITPKGKLRAATYFGGTGFEMLEGIAIAPDGTIWATGLTSSRGLATPDHHGVRTDAVLLRWPQANSLRR